MTKDDILELIENGLTQIINHKEISLECEVIDLVIDFHNKAINILEVTRELLIQRDIPINYLNQFKADIDQIIKIFPFRQHPISIVQPDNKIELKKSIENHMLSLENPIKTLEFNIDFFQKLNFFSSNIVAIGANGSGKTTLSNELKKYLPSTGVVISAQKVLIIPTFSGVSNFEKTHAKLRQSQVSDKSLKVTYSTESNGNSYGILNQLGGEFQVLLDNLLAERSVVRNKYFETLKDGEVVKDVPITKLDRTLTIWNSLIQHRILECTDGINITLKALSSTVSYPAHQMSDGEKVILYLIAHVLQAPESGFIISDEPEMYLHKSILKKLWDTLEQLRQDCIFVYLTHDLDFAASRITAKKVWIKSFAYPNIWEIENIPHNELPESLLLELLGSRKPILFCEGKNGSIDEKIYNILFPNFTVTPVETCFSVINYTKAFNKLHNVTVKAIGLIDSDYHGSERLKALEVENIFSIALSEPENLFFDESFLKIMSKQLMLEMKVVDEIKSDLFLLLRKEIELQASNYVSAKINYYFKDSHVSKGNTLEDVNQNYLKFSSEVNITEWHKQRITELNEIVENQDYQKAISIFNNKGLKALGNKNFKITDFTERAIKTLQFKPETQIILKEYFPKEIRNYG